MFSKRDSVSAMPSWWFVGWLLVASVPPIGSDELNVGRSAVDVVGLSAEDVAQRHVLGPCRDAAVGQDAKDVFDALVASLREASGKCLVLDLLLDSS